MIPVGRVSYPTVLIVFKYSSGLDLIIKIKISEKFIKYENPIGFFRIGIPIQGNVKYYALLMVMLYNVYQSGMIGFDGRGWSRIASREVPTS